MKPLAVLIPGITHDTHLARRCLAAFDNMSGKREYQRDLKLILTIFQTEISLSTLNTTDLSVFSVYFGPFEGFFERAEESTGNMG